jgi:hypothetical protein
MDRPGQEISKVQLTPYRDNTVAATLEVIETPASVRQIMTHIETEAPIKLEERDVRTTLKSLIEEKRIRLLTGKVQRFDLI